ncbi:MAG TPA: tRNA pseudouridine(38-40) synthase TruA [Alphaproteobacteria bacterium]|nr:tRNA pseudouridine(38-40) synthase TruA [Alphaproteobacteria bacterium]
MTRWKITVEYDGAGFCGWQRQAHDLSVQQVLEDAVQKFSGETVTLHVAGRTDTGVHAETQVAHFDLNKEFPADTIRDAMNFHVRPHRVVVLKAEAVSNDFHARFSALDRSYRYQILNRRAPPALMNDVTWHVPKPLDIARMQEAANVMLGKHDFSTFRAADCQSNSPIKTLDKFDIRREDELVICDVGARSFLYHQVRNMVGTLVMVGTGQWSVGDFKTAFEAKDRTKGGPTAPPQGLFFVGVSYSKD